GYFYSLPFDRSTQWLRLLEDSPATLPVGPSFATAISFPNDPEDNTRSRLAANLRPAGTRVSPEDGRTLSPQASSPQARPCSSPAAPLAEMPESSAPDSFSRTTLRPKLIGALGWITAAREVTAIGMSA